MHIEPHKPSLRVLPDLNALMLWNRCILHSNSDRDQWRNNAHCNGHDYESRLQHGSQSDERLRKCWFQHNLNHNCRSSKRLHGNRKPVFNDLAFRPILQPVANEYCSRLISNITPDVLGSRWSLHRNSNRFKRRANTHHNGHGDRGRLCRNRKPVDRDVPNRNI